MSTVKRIVPEEDWPVEWKSSYKYDLEEVYGDISCRGYAFAYQNRQRHTFDLLRKYASPPARVLDVAAAQGNFSIILSEMGYSVTWNDLREDMIPYVRMKAEREIEFCPGNVFDLEFKEPFDVVLIAEVIEHVAHPDQFLQKVAAMVRPGGIVMLTTPNGEYFQNKLPKFSDCSDPSIFESIQFKPNSDGHIFLLQYDELIWLAKASGLEICDICYFSNPLTSGFLKTEFLLKILPRYIVDSLEQGSRWLPLPLLRKMCVQVAAVYRKSS